MLTTEDQIARHSFEARANTGLPKEAHSQKYDRSFLCSAQDRISGPQMKTLSKLLRYAAGNENVSESWVEAGLEKLLGVDHLSEIKQGDFCRTVEALIEILGI